jgi:L-asparaginase
MKKSSVLLIYTGGTIGMINDPVSGELKPFNFNQLFAEVPELKKFDIDIEAHAFEEPIDSSNMKPSIWVKLALLIQSNYNQYDGFVILHGSDTMAYSASALSFMLENLTKPVIFTGSQLPIGTIRTDGKENLITSIEIAAAKKDGVAIVPEVAIYFEYALYRGNRTKKISAEHFEAFDSPNYPKLAEAGVHIKYNYGAIRRISSNRPLRVFEGWSDEVGYLKLFPGISASFFNHVISQKQLKGIVIETYGAGNAPNEPWLQESLKKAIDNSLIVLNVTQCNSGKVDQKKYETGSHLEKVGVIGGGDLTTEAAITKLMLLLGDSSLDRQDVVRQLKQNLRGEMSDSV